MSSEIDTGNTLQNFIRRHRIYVDKDILHISFTDVPHIPIDIWKQLPDHAVQILEQVGYTKYDRNTDSIVFVEN